MSGSRWQGMETRTGRELMINSQGNQEQRRRPAYLPGAIP